MNPAEVHEYDRFEKSGLEQCPICGRTLGATGHMGPVWDQELNRTQWYYETDPENGPFYCRKKCALKVWKAVRQSENKQLGDYA